MANIGACLWDMATLVTDFVCIFILLLLQCIISFRRHMQGRIKSNVAVHVDIIYIYSHQLMNAPGYLEFVC